MLDCTFEACSEAACCYHQECLERYLKSIRCERCVRRRTPLRVLALGAGRPAAGAPLAAPARALTQDAGRRRACSNRKTGFKCPRGCGKQTAFERPCPGKVDKSHPIHPRAEATKRRKKAPPPPPPPPPPKPAKPAAKPVEKPAAAAAPAKPPAAAAPAKPAATPVKPATPAAPTSKCVRRRGGRAQRRRRTP